MPRKKMPKKEKKKVIWAFVKAKHYTKAKADIREIERKYNTEESKVAV